MEKPQFVYVTYIATTREKLWEALTGGEFTRQYWGGRKITSDWTVGSPVHHFKEDGTLEWKGEVLVYDPPNKLSYTFDVLTDEEMPDYKGEKADLVNKEKPSRVTFELKEYMGEVCLTLVHDNFEMGSKIIQGISNGWPAILSGLKTLLETGKTLYPDWR